MKTKTLTKLFILTFFFSLIHVSVVYSAYIKPGTNNSTNTRGGCTYELKDNFWPLLFWTLPSPVVVYNANWSPCAECTTSEVLRVKWKNVKANAYVSSLTAWYGATSTWIDLQAFTLYMPSPEFTVGTSLNIPCHITNTTTISLKPYINTGTQSENIDENEIITDEFEWTLPTGWQTNSGQSGTFVGSSSISVIPSVSSSSASIIVRAKANLQYSSPATLQITRNLEDFSIAGPVSVVYNSTYRYTAPSYSGISYSWQLPTGWSGSSTSNYIDVTVGCGSGNITATMTGCNGSKNSSLTVTQSIIAPGTTVSGTDFVCSSGNQFNVPGLASGTTVTWTSSGNITLSNAAANYCTYSANSNGEGWIEATVNAPSCGTSVTLPRKTIWAGVPVINYISGSNQVDAYGMAYYEAITQLNPGTIYIWSVSPTGTVSSSGKSANIYFQGDGDYHVYVTATNYCGTSTAELFVGVGVNDPYIIYPNPGDDNITLQASQYINFMKNASITERPTKSEICEIRILNEQGTSMKVQQTKQLPLNIPTGNLPNGKYIIQVVTSGKTWNKQLLIKH